MQDKILEGFLTRQQREGMELAQASDLLDLFPLGGRPAQRYVAPFRCRGLVRSDKGDVEVAEHHEIGIFFPSDYLRRANPAQVLTWLGPSRIWHPNIGAPFICIGRLQPGTPLADILYQCFEIITFKKVTMREDDALNREACSWARQNQHRFPVDDRSLKRRAVPIQAEISERTARR